MIFLKVLNISREVIQPWGLFLYDINVLLCIQSRRSIIMHRDSNQQLVARSAPYIALLFETRSFSTKVIVH